MILKSFRDLAIHLETADSPLAENLRERRDRQAVHGSGRRAENAKRKAAAWRRIIDRNKAKLRG